MKEIMITSTVLILVLVMVRKVFLGKVSSRFLYALWGLVALRLLLPFTWFESSFSVLNLPQYSYDIVSKLGLMEPDK